MNDLDTKTTESLLATAVRKGQNRKDALLALHRVLRDHEGYNLASALMYEGFASERVALKVAGIK